MSLPPPDWSSLWGDIVTHHPAIQWPLIDARNLDQLADDWGRFGAAFLISDYKYTEPDLLQAWTGEAGREYQRRMAEAHRNAREAFHLAREMRDLVRAFHHEVGRSTNEIWDLMEKHEDFYLDLTWSLFAWFHPEEAGREAEKYRNRIAGEVSVILRTALAQYRSAVERLDAQAASRG